MERLEFDCDYDISNEIKSIIENTANENYLISIYGRYDVIKTILESLITDGLTIANEIKLEDYDISHYDKEFVLYVFNDEVNVEKAYHNGSYLYGSGDISFVHEDCSSTLLKYIDSDKVYEFGYIDNEDLENCKDMVPKGEYTVNGEKVDKETFDAYVSKFVPDKVGKEEDKFDSDGCSISVKYNFDTDEVFEIIKDMERCMNHMNDIFREMNCFRRLFNW